MTGGATSKSDLCHLPQLSKRVTVSIQTTSQCIVWTADSSHVRMDLVGVSAHVATEGLLFDRLDHDVRVKGIRDWRVPNLINTYRKLNRDLPTAQFTNYSRQEFVLYISTQLSLPLPLQFDPGFAHEVKSSRYLSE